MTTDSKLDKQTNKTDGELTVSTYQPDNENYQSELKLRDSVLRLPLGMSIYAENLDVDQQSIHIGAFMDKQLVGVLLLTEVNAERVKMRQVAVNEIFRGQKVGSKMVMFAEVHSKQLGYTTLVLNARKTALGFYQKLGYSIVGDEFLEIKIPHYKMEKRL